MSPESVDTQLASAPLEVATNASRDMHKVQLDIDDAPFLREPEPEPPPPSREDGVSDEPLEVPSPPAEDKAAGKKKKLILIGVAALAVVLAGGGGALWWFVLRTPPPPPPVPQVMVVPSTPTESAPADFLIPFAPFWLELSGDSPRNQDAVFFLVCKFTALSKSEALLQEAQSKVIVIRDALYFYLKNKTYSFLTDPAHTQAIKNDLASVINGYLAGGKVEEVLFERYITR